VEKGQRKPSGISLHQSVQHCARRVDHREHDAGGQVVTLRQTAQHLVALAHEDDAFVAREVAVDPGDLERGKVTAAEAGQAVGGHAHAVEKPEERGVGGVDGDERFGKGLGREGTGVIAVTGGGREDVVGGGEGFGVSCLERLLQLVEGAATILEDQAKVTQHVGIKRDGTREQESDASARAETVPEEVGAAFVADTSGIFGEFLVGLCQAVTQIGD